LPGLKQIQNIYDTEDNYFKDEQKGVDYVQGEQWLKQTAKFYIAFISEVVEDFKNRPLNILDFGCGTGVLIKEFTEIGHNACGVEMSKWASNFGKKRYGIDIREGDILKTELPKNYFDIITMIHVIEHLPTLRVILQKLHPLLKRGVFSSRNT